MGQVSSAKAESGDGVNPEGHSAELKTCRKERLGSAHLRLGTRLGRPTTVAITCSTQSTPRQVLAWVPMFSGSLGAHPFHNTPRSVSEFSSVSLSNTMYSVSFLDTMHLFSITYQTSLPKLFPAQGPSFTQTPRWRPSGAPVESRKTWANWICFTFGSFWSNLAWKSVSRNSCKIRHQKKKESGVQKHPK